MRRVGTALLFALMDDIAGLMQRKNGRGILRGHGAAFNEPIVYTEPVDWAAVRARVREKQGVGTGSLEHSSNRINLGLDHMLLRQTDKTRRLFLKTPCVGLRAPSGGSHVGVYFS